MAPSIRPSLDDLIAGASPKPSLESLIAGADQAPPVPKESNSLQALHRAYKSGQLQKRNADLAQGEAVGPWQDAEALSQVLYTDYLLLFQMSGIVLLVAMMGAIVLTLRSRPSVKRQNIAEQTGRKRKDAVELKDVRPGQGI